MLTLGTPNNGCQPGAGGPLEAGLAGTAPPPLPAQWLFRIMYIMLKLAAAIRSWLGSCIRWWLAGLVDRHRTPKDTELAA